MQFFSNRTTPLTRDEITYKLIRTTFMSMLGVAACKTAMYIAHQKYNSK